MQFRDPGVIIFACPDRGVELVVIGDVVPVQALGAGLEIGRSVGMTDPELIKIRHNFARLPEGEVLVELQAVGRDWNSWMLGFHNVPVVLNGSEGSSAARSENRETIFARLTSRSLQSRAGRFASEHRADTSPADGKRRTPYELNGRRSAVFG